MEFPKAKLLFVLKKFQTFVWHHFETVKLMVYGQSYQIHDRILFGKFSQKVFALVFIKASSPVFLFQKLSSTHFTPIWFRLFWKVLFVIACHLIQRFDLKNVFFSDEWSKSSNIFFLAENYSIMSCRVSSSLKIRYIYVRLRNNISITYTNICGNPLDNALYESI